jgi:hypothetical protein
VCQQGAGPWFFRRLTLVFYQGAGPWFFEFLLASLAQDCTKNSTKMAPSRKLRRRVLLTNSPSSPQPSSSLFVTPPQQRDEDLGSVASTEALNSNEIESLNFNELVSHLDREESNDADGGDSDCEGEEMEILDESLSRSTLDREENEKDFHVKEISSGDIGFMLSKKENVLDLIDDEEENNILLSVPKPPVNWVKPPKKATDKESEPDFKDVPNPGNWNDFIYRPVYSKTGTGINSVIKYVRHELPTGCSVVPLNNENVRATNGWKFYYRGEWESNRNENYHARSGATPKNLFPQERASSLDPEILRMLGLNEQRVKDSVSGEPDALFFLQLLLPLCDPEQSGVIDDPRTGYYMDVMKYSNLYKYQNGIGSGYGHRIDEVQPGEYVRFDGCVIRDGVLGGGDGALYRRWQPSSSASDKHISDSLTLERFHQLKRILKLNNNDTAKKQGEEGYDPCYKYDLIYKVIIANTIALTKNADLDLTIDETSWGHQGYGEKGGGNLFRIMNKPGVSKGGQLVIASATNRVRPYWYQNRHKHTPRYLFFNSEGMAEMRTLIDSMESHIVGREGEKKKIFKKPPHITADNYFSGEAVFRHAGKKGFGCLATTRRDRLPKDVKSEFFHKKKTDSSQRTKVARYIPPVVAVKEEEDFDIVHTSFQSTSSCNIMSVNSMKNCKNFVEIRTRGRKKNKRKYCIEQNMARLLYLNSYSRIDSIDHMIKNCKLFYVSWKYWHSPKNHALSLAIVTAYDMYLEITEGAINPAYANKDPVSFFTFRDILSKQMTAYDPRKQLYPGDEKLRVVTQLNKKKRKAMMSKAVAYNKDNECNENGSVSYCQFVETKRQKRFCDLNSYTEHLMSIESHKHAAKCMVCSEITYKRCALCGVSLHNMDSRGKGKGRNCFLEWHDVNNFGLCFGDRKLVGVKTSDWKPPTTTKLNRNKRLIKGYLMK